MTAAPPLRVLVLGAGFGGLELSSCLSEELGAEVSVTLIDRTDSFVFGFSKLDVMFGRAQPDAVSNRYRDIVKPGVEFRQETIVSIDPRAKRVVTDGGEHEADVLVVALGADLDLGATPGLAEVGTEFYSEAGAEALREPLRAFAGGTAAIVVMGPFFKCPPAPHEAAMLLHDELVRRGTRDAADIVVAIPMPVPIPISPDSSQGILDAYRERDIEFVGGATVERVDPRGRTVDLAGGRKIAFDLLLAVPVHKAPDVVLASDLAVDGWIAVDQDTLETPFPDVYAVGDVTSEPVPRAGVFAEGEARVVAAGIVARHRGTAGPPRYEGTGTCYIQFGSDGVGKTDINILGGPSPAGTFIPPSPVIVAEKQDFGASRRRRWFGA